MCMYIGTWVLSEERSGCWMSWSWGFTGSCEPLDAGTGSQTPVLCQSSQWSSLPVHLCSPNGSVFTVHTHDDFIVKNRVFVQLTSNSFYNYYIFIYSFCVHVCVVCVSLHTSMWVWLAEDNFQESVFFFDFVGPGIKLRSSRLAKIHWEIRFGFKFSSLYKNKHIHVTFNK